MLYPERQSSRTRKPEKNSQFAPENQELKDEMFPFKTGSRMVGDIPFIFGKKHLE